MTFRCLTSQEMDARRERLLAERYYWRGFFVASLVWAALLTIAASIVISTARL